VIDSSAVESALDELRPGLGSDGFDLRVGSIAPDNAVEVILAALPDACLDCLVPDELMVNMLEDAIRRQDPAVSRVDLVKVGFDTVTPH
jgi:Fe-S cluster biogenesis protein NfuA